MLSTSTTPVLSPLGNFLARILNLAPHESARVAFAWSIRFFVQIGYTIGWTMLTAMFVNRLGLTYLPLLVAANAGLVIIGTMAMSTIFERLARRTLLLATATTGVVLVGTAIALLQSIGDLRLFFACALIAESFFFAQLNILIGLFIEDLFSPLESERAFPIIDTSEYIGSIAGGALILLAVDAFHLDAPMLTYLWATAIGCVIPLLVVFYHRRQKLPSLRFRVKERGSHFEKISEGFGHIRATPFLAGLLFVVLLQWTLVTLLNFQYTTAIDANVSHATATKDISGEPMHGSGENTATHEDLLTHGLSVLHITFALIALTSQLLITSRVLERWGIVRTLTLHPIITIATTIGLTFKYGFSAAVASKGLFEVTAGMWNAGYHASFYALRESIREHAKEVLEGFIRPLGVICGTTILFVMQFLFVGETRTLAINLAMLGSAVMMGILLLWSRERYTRVSKKNLELFGNHPAKFTSVEVLAQAGHPHAADILVKNLTYKKESPELRVKILETLGHLHDAQTIPHILTCFDDASPSVKLAAVQALGEFRDLGAQFYTQAFTHYRVITALKELFAREDSKELRSAIVRVFGRLNQIDVIPFLVETLTSTDESVRADCVYVCGLFHDVSAAHYLEPFLVSKDPYEKANAIIALWQFPHYRLRLTIQLGSLLEADDRTTQKAAIHMLGEIGALQERPRLEAFLHSDDDELRLLAALALAKLGRSDVVDVLADYLLHDDDALARLARKHIRTLNDDTQKRIHAIVHHKLSATLTQLLAETHATSLDELSPPILTALRHIYTRADDWDEVAKLDAAIAGQTFD